MTASRPSRWAGGLEFGAEADGLAELVRRCRALTMSPLVTRLSPGPLEIPAMAQVAQHEGADAVSLVNTIPGMLRARLGNGAGGVSGPALLAVGVLATRRVAQRLPGPGIGVGGLGTAGGARAHLHAGASL